MANKIYLGDSVYAEFDTVIAGDVTLTTENGYGPSNTIYLEPEVMTALHKFHQRVGAARAPEAIRQCGEALTDALTNPSSRRQ